MPGKAERSDDIFTLRGFVKQKCFPAVCLNNNRIIQLELTESGMWTWKLMDGRITENTLHVID